ncbi:MAG: hypothetical protein MPJ50_13445 [Pirellulales bacterium]|nr:hypothetical protein [Pirellulales bacterium]
MNSPTESPVPHLAARSSCLALIFRKTARCTAVLIGLVVVSLSVVKAQRAFASDSWSDVDKHGADKTVIVIRDYRLLSAAEFAQRASKDNGDLTEDQLRRNYSQHVNTVQKVQREQYSVTRRALLQYGVKKLFVESVPQEDLAERVKLIQAWAERASSADQWRKEAIKLRDTLNQRRQAGETDGDFQQILEQFEKAQSQFSQFTMEGLKYGVSARLMAADDLSFEIGAMDNSQSLELYQPGSLSTPENAEARAAREKLLAKVVAAWLEEHDTAILVLSGDCDLRDEFRELGLTVQYGAATVPSIPK